MPEMGFGANHHVVQRFGATTPCQTLETKADDGFQVVYDVFRCFAASETPLLFISRQLKLLKRQAKQLQKVQVFFLQQRALAPSFNSVQK